MNAPDPSAWLTAPLPETIDVEIDARGLLCPLPILKLANALRDAEPGRCILTISTDRGFFPDLLRWLRVRPHRLLALRQSESGDYRAWIRREAIDTGANA